MKKTFLLGIAFTAFLLPPCSAAQTAPRTASSPHTEMARLAAEMAESRYKLRPSDDSMFALLEAYEHMTALECMPDLLKTLRHSSGGSKIDCTEWIEKTLKLFPEDSIAICARDGIDSPTCLDASRDQGFEVLQMTSSPSGVPDLDAKLESLRDEPAENDYKRANTVGSLRREYEASKTDQKLKEFTAAAGEALNDSCKVKRIIFRKTGVDTGRSRGPLGLEYSKKQPKENEVKVKLKRSIAVSARCQNYVNQALEVAPYFPQAVCIKYGPYSPQCIDAHRRWRQRYGGEHGGGNKGAGEGFQTF